MLQYRSQILKIGYLQKHGEKQKLIIFYFNKSKFLLEIIYFCNHYAKMIMMMCHMEKFGKT